MADTPLEGRVALVTGAGTGLGAAIATTLAAAGADVMLQYRSHRTGTERVAAACRAVGRRAELVQIDLAGDAGSATTLVETAVERMGRIDILVNNAAITTRAEPFLDHSRLTFQEIMAVNVEAPFLATQAAARHMIAAGSGGRIVNIGSVHAKQSAPTWTAYEVSKGAVAALTFSTAVALGPHGITVNSVAPGVVVVERYEDLDFDRDWAVGRIPLGRLGVPTDIAGAVRFLVSDEASFITGQTLVVDGGMTKRMSLVR